MATPISTPLTCMGKKLKKLAESIAPYWSRTSAYAVGDAVLYKLKRYVCKTAVAEGGEAWDAEKWTAQTVSEALAALAPTATTEADSGSGAE